MLAIRLLLLGLVAAICLIWVVAIAAMLPGCGPQPPPVPPPPVEDICGAAAANLAVLDCPGSTMGPGQDAILGTEDDVAVFETCRQHLALDPSAHPLWECAATAEDCEQMQGCGQ